MNIYEPVCMSFDIIHVRSRSSPRFARFSASVRHASHNAWYGSGGVYGLHVSLGLLSRLCIFHSLSCECISVNNTADIARSIFTLFSYGEVFSTCSMLIVRITLDSTSASDSDSVSVYSTTFLLLIFATLYLLWGYSVPFG